MSRDDDCKVYVGGLPAEASSEELDEAFSKYGRLRKVWVARRPPGFAFIQFEDVRDAEDAVKAMDGAKLCGVRARVELSSGRRRDGGRGGDRGGGGRYGGRGGGDRYDDRRGGGYDRGYTGSMGRGRSPMTPPPRDRRDDRRDDRYRNSSRSRSRTPPPRASAAQGSRSRSRS